jgi:uncharacterized protein YbcV (DUF1398 family)
MQDRLTQVAEKCLHGAENQTMTFPQIVGALMQAGFESYSIDFRRAKAIYYCPDGDSVELPTHRLDVAVSGSFDTAAIQAAILEAQHLVSGYTYEGFCRKVMDAGCAGYMVSFTGRRVLYYGRTAEIHVEHFPK